MKSRRRRSRAGWLVAASIALALAVFAVRAFRSYERPYRGWSGERVVLVVPKGAPASQIYRRLAEVGLVESASLARVVHRVAFDEAPLRAGEYAFDRALAPREVLDALVAGRCIEYRVTLREGLDRWQVAEELARALDWVEPEALAIAISDPSLVADLAPEAGDLEGYLFPETYAFTRDTPARQVVEELVETFRRRFADSVGAVGVPSGRTTHEIVTLASIVEAETGAADERPRIAAVYDNRLRLGMALQADPTVIYALKLAGSWDGDIRRRDLALDSPYNTYVRAGLPPGPIANPGSAALEAALQPASSRDLYFVSRNDGTHVFSPDYASHQRAVETWQKSYWRRRRAEERGR